MIFTHVVRNIAMLKLLALFVPLMMLVAIACSPSEKEIIEGILQNVDSINGEITIVTKDGKTITLTIATQAPVETEGGTSAIETLEPGASVELEVTDEGQVVQRIEARQAKVEGFIVGIEGDKVTVESERGRSLTVTVTSQTRIRLEDDFPGTLANLVVGQEVKIKYDPTSLVALRVDSEEEEAEIEGVVVEVGDNQVTIETDRGRRLTLIVGSRTRIELDDDLPGTFADLQVGQAVEAKFDPYTRTAFKIEVHEDQEDDEDDEDDEDGRDLPVAP
jgi:ribosome maturation factor RimP